jgi:N-acetylmuramoyl-L-alanine amidase
MPDYTVKQGDCISSIAEGHGFFWERIWNHPKNAELKTKRENPNVLAPGDVVFVPDKEEKEESCATGQRHTFRKKGVPAKLRLRLVEDDKPRANEPYILEIDGVTFSGTTDGEGGIEHPIPPNAVKGKLLVGEKQEEFPLDLGHLDPVDEITGVQARLNNLGFDCGSLDGEAGPETEAALKEFQKKHNLDESGRPDEATRSKLQELHGS